MFFAPLLLSLAAVAVAAPQGPIDPIILEGTATAFIPSGLSSCGFNLPSGAFAAGLSQDYLERFQPPNDSNSNHNTACGKHIEVLYNGKSVKVEVIGSGGDAGFDIILSAAAFEVLSGTNTGVINVGWEQLDF